MNKNVKRGQVWFYRPSIERPGHIQRGPRPVIIVSADAINEHSSIVLAVPCTTQIKRNYPSHTLFVMNNTVSVALTEQAGPVCIDELVECKLTLPKYVMDQIDNALSISYGLKPMPAFDYSQPSQRPRPVKPTTENKGRIRWTGAAMKKFLLDLSSLGSVDRVASKYGLTVSTANAYKSKFETLVGSNKES